VGFIAVSLMQNVGYNVGGVWSGIDYYHAVREVMWRRQLQRRITEGDVLSVCDVMSMVFCGLFVFNACG